MSDFELLCKAFDGKRSDEVNHSLIYQQISNYTRVHNQMVHLFIEKEDKPVKENSILVLDDDPEDVVRLVLGEQCRS